MAVLFMVCNQVIQTGDADTLYLGAEQTLSPFQKPAPSTYTAYWGPAPAAGAELLIHIERDEAVS